MKNFTQRGRKIRGGGEAISNAFGHRPETDLFQPGRDVWHDLPWWLRVVFANLAEQLECAVRLKGTLAAQQVIGRTYNPLPIYLLAAAIYFVINYSLSVASRRLEARYAFIRE